jgi:hypothetical protein
MAELAFNHNGDPFEVPAEAVAWRVRRIKGRGAPEVVYGANGAPLVLPVDAAFEDLRREAKVPGKYRLDPINEDHQVLEGASPSYLVLPERPDPEDVAERISPPSSSGVALESALGETTRALVGVTQAVVAQLPAIMAASADLLRAAGASGLPSRAPLALVPGGDDDEQDEDDEGDEELEPSSAPSKASHGDLYALMAQLLPPLMAAFAPRPGSEAGSAPPAPPSPSVASKRRSPASPMEGSSSTEPAAAPPVAGGPTPPAAVPPLSPKGMMHFAAIQQALTLEERALAQGILSELSPDQVQAWLRELAPLSVAEAVEKIRPILNGSLTAQALSQEAA